eukprot:762657-Hanusia_phi.AAC.3
MRRREAMTRLQVVVYAADKPETLARVTSHWVDVLCAAAAAAFDVPQASLAAGKQGEHPRGCCWEQVRPQGRRRAQH